MLVEVRPSSLRIAIYRPMKISFLAGDEARGSDGTHHTLPFQEAQGEAGAVIVFGRQRGPGRYARKPLAPQLRLKLSILTTAPSHVGWGVDQVCI